MVSLRETMKKVSIIVPVKYINAYIHEAIPYHLNLEYDDFELIIFPDRVRKDDLVCGDSRLNINLIDTYDGLSEYVLANDNRVRIIESGEVGPAEKRDLAFIYAKGDIFAFTDDDAYPRADWLRNAVSGLEDETVGAIGGPAVTAMNDDILKIGSGKVYESFLCSGGYTYRYIPGVLKEDDDIPSVNLIVKREVFEEVKGYDSTFYPGEDTKLCMDIVNTGKKLIYDPNVLVYHHRRSLFKGHLKQVTNYAKHRGYFAKKLPQTSLRPAYFIPTAFTVGLFGGPLVCMALPVLWYFYFGVLGIYLFLALWSLRSCLQSGNVLYRICLLLLSLAGIVVTHVGYGVCFVRGLLSKELIR